MEKQARTLVAIVEDCRSECQHHLAHFFDFCEQALLPMKSCQRLAKAVSMQVKGKYIGTQTACGLGAKAG